MARVGYFPEGVLEEIMSWLPPESVMRFKLVQKSWYLQINALMNDPAFVAKHLRNAKRNALPPASYCRFQCIMCDPGEDALACRPYPNHVNSDMREAKRCLLILANDYQTGKDWIPCGTDDERRKLTRQLYWCCLKLACHCDGIICLSNLRYDTVYLLNPGIREMKTIHCSCYGLKDDDLRGEAFGYELRGVGFGYDCRSDEYKVVVFMASPVDVDVGDDGPYKAELYSLKTKAWREVNFDLSIDHVTYEHDEVYCNGACYWYYWYDELVMFSFDFSNEVFRDVPLPVGLGTRVPEEWDCITDWTRICVWKESVVLFMFPGEASKVIDMWVLDSKPGSAEGLYYSWGKYRRIEPLEGIQKPLGFWDDVELFLESEDVRIKLYHLRYEVVSDFFGGLDCLRHGLFAVYQKSLVSVLNKEGRRRQVVQL